MIPKTIHYCWFGGSELPELCKRCVSSWENNLADYEIKLWDESSLPSGVPFLSDMLKQKKWAFVSDYMRLYALYHEGGIYFDTDIEVISNFDDLLDCSCFLGEESNGRATTGVIAAEAGHPYIKACMDLMEERHRRNLEYLIAPEIACLGLKGYENEVVVYPPEYFYPYNPYDASKSTSVLMFSDITRHTKAIHHWNHGWKLGLVERVVRTLKKVLNV